MLRPQSRPDQSARICLAASGGGHVRQLLDLEPYWGEKSFFFLTEDTALGRTLAEQWPVRFVPHFAFGQARIASPLKMVASGWRNFFTSLRIVLEERPTHVISTGAGAVFFAVLIARLLGAQILLIESFARFEKPSLFFKIAAPFAQNLVVQSELLLNFYPRARLFDPLKIYNGPSPEKRALLFATVGATLPFDRLVKAVEIAKRFGAIFEDVIVQTGEGGYHPAGIETHDSLSFEEMNSLQERAELVVCHAGTGSLITALRHGCKVIVMPRNPVLGEHYDNHQLDITRAFAARKLISVAMTAADLPNALAAARAREVVFATTTHAPLITYLKKLW